MTEPNIDPKRLARVKTLDAGSHDPNGKWCAIRAKLDALTVRADNGCWIWRGYTQPNGYGWINVGGVKIAAHRAALMLNGVDVPDGMDVCHRCDVRDCVNPDHLYVGSRRENMADCTARGRHNKPVGERHWCAKLAASDVREIRARRQLGETCRALAIAFKVNNGTISRIARGTWRGEVA